jgi:hypothetical protein
MKPVAAEVWRSKLNVTIKCAVINVHHLIQPAAQSSLSFGSWLSLSWLKILCVFFFFLKTIHCLAHMCAATYPFLDSCEFSSQSSTWFVDILIISVYFWVLPVVTSLQAFFHQKLFVSLHACYIPLCPILLNMVILKVFGYQCKISGFSLSSSIFSSVDTA